MRIASVSVDLDSLPHYCRIHGLDDAMVDATARRLVYSTALPRLEELFARVGISATLFAIGEDLGDPAMSRSLDEASKVGHEVGSHSFRHDYAMSRASVGAIAADLAAADAAIHQATGRRPQGFRAPGYTLSPTLYQAVCDLGYRYDSSAFPASAYYLAKGAVMAALSVAGRPSRAILDSPRVLLAPRLPYRPDPASPYRRGSGSVVEFPVAVTRLVGFPFIGTFALTLPGPMVRAAYRTLRGEPFLNFELHGIDALDADDGVPAALCERQRDLLVPHRKKLARLAEVLTWLKQDFEVCRLADAAARPSVVSELAG